MRKLKITLLFFLLTFWGYGQEVSFDTILVNNKLTFKIKIKTVKKISLLTSTFEGKTSVIDTIEIDGLAYIKYSDFDKDGNKDILIDYYGNNSSYFLYLFDQKTNKFRKIKNYISFPDAFPLKSNPKYYYSYHKAGCADMNWESDLFKIKNFKIVHLGNIEAKGCNFDIKENPQVIEIYKIPNNDERDKIKIAKHPYKKYIKKFEEKWDFIDEYWNTNYAKFK